jgi:hypothetical protein
MLRGAGPWVDEPSPSTSLRPSGGSVFTAGKRGRFERPQGFTPSFSSIFTALVFAGSSASDFL